MPASPTHLELLAGTLLRSDLLGGLSVLGIHVSTSQVLCAVVNPACLEAGACP